MPDRSRLERHTKPIGLLNLEGYRAPLITLLTNCIDKGFADEHLRDSLIVGDQVSDVIERIAGLA